MAIGHDGFALGEDFYDEFRRLSGREFRRGKWRGARKEADPEAAAEHVVSGVKELAAKIEKIDSEEELDEILAEVTKVAIDLAKLLEDQEELLKEALSEMNQVLEEGLPDDQEIVDNLWNDFKNAFEEDELPDDIFGNFGDPGGRGGSGSDAPDENEIIRGVADAEGNVRNAQVGSLFSVGEPGCGRDDHQQTEYQEDGTMGQLGEDIADKLLASWLANALSADHEPPEED